MKKLSRIVCILMLILMTAACTSNPYTGTYIYHENSDVSLVLNGDNSFSLNRTLDKFENKDVGKYTINNNKIILTFNKEVELSKSVFSTLKGEIDGSKITFDKVESYFLKDSN